MQSRGLQAVVRIRRQLPGPCVTLTGTFSISLFSLCFLQLEISHLPKLDKPGAATRLPGHQLLGPRHKRGRDSARSHEQARPGKGPRCLPCRLGLLHFTK